MEDVPRPKASRFVSVPLDFAGGRQGPARAPGRGVLGVARWLPQVPGLGWVSVFVFIKFAVVLGDSVLCSSVKFLLIYVCRWVTPQAVSVHPRHISFSHFQAPPHLSRASLLWVFLQRAGPAQKPEVPMCATKYICSLSTVRVEIPTWRAPLSPQGWWPEIP